ncbi:MAG: DUF4124 domain-containing protein [Halothiobacillaceae bacterium]
MLSVVLGLVAFEAVAQSIYRCEGPDGQIIFSDIPCSPGYQSERRTLERDPGAPSSATPPLSPPQKTGQPLPDPSPSASAPVDEPAAVDHILRCGKFSFRDLTPVTSEFVSGVADYYGNVAGYVDKYRCAAGQVRLDGQYGSRINDRDLAREAAGQLLAEMLDGRILRGHGGRISGPGRLNLGTWYRGQFCFGDSDAEIVEFHCR